jgi:hypothetical protein
MAAGRGVVCRFTSAIRLARLQSSSQASSGLERDFRVTLLPLYRANLRGTTAHIARAVP